MPFLPMVHGELDCLQIFQFKYYKTLIGHKDLRQSSACSGNSRPYTPYTIALRFVEFFAGRLYGGGDRWTIYTTRAFGKPFPYRMWPISLGGNYAGSGAQASTRVRSRVYSHARGGRLMNVELVSRAKDETTPTKREFIS